MKYKYPLVIAAIVVIAGSGWFFGMHKTSKKNSTAKIQGAVSRPTPHTAAPSTNNGTANNGGAVDNNGSVNNNLPPESKWSSSANGAITLQQPYDAQDIKPGDTISGLAKVNSVSFLLKDDSVGIIAQGNLKVVNGKFSGTLQFTPHASTGKLEV